MSDDKSAITRRRALLVGACSAIALGGGAAVVRNQLRHPFRQDRRVVPDGRYRRLVLAWPASQDMTLFTIAQKKGFFQRYNLDVRLAPHVDSSAQAFGSVASGQAVAAVAPMLNWLVRYQRGLETMLVAGLQTGDYRLMVPRSGRINRLAALAQQTIALPQGDDSSQLFFSAMLRRKGINPVLGVRWIYVPQDELFETIKSGRASAVAAKGESAHAFLVEHETEFFQLVSSLGGSYRQRVDLVLGMSSAQLQYDPKSAVALVLALKNAADWVHDHPAETIALTHEDSEDDFSAEQEATALHFLKERALGIFSHESGLEDQVAQSVDEMKLLGYISNSVNSRLYAHRICTGVLRAKH